MNRREELIVKKQLQQERLQVLQKQTDLKSRYCQICSNNQTNNLDICYECDIYGFIRELGDQLTAITYKKRHLEPPPLKQNIDLSLLFPTVETYEELKRIHKTDKAIADHLNIYIGALHRWKRKHNVFTCRNKRQQKAKSHEPLHEKGGIS